MRLSLLLLLLMFATWSQARVTPTAIGKAWTDRRPIAQFFLAQAQYVTKGNPSGYLNPDVNVMTGAGREAFRKLLLESADRWIGILKENHAQGMIVWDLEGQSQTSMAYVGDPRILPEYAPEMDAVAKAFFKKFTDAGLRTGVTIRPNMITRIPPEGVAQWGKWGYSFQRERDVVRELSAMITYAQGHWGCTIFYMDSNSYADNDSKDGFSPSHLITATMLKALRTAHPDVLIIPEHPVTGGQEWTAQYHELRGGWLGTPDDVRQQFSGAFTVLSIGGGKADQIQEHWDALVDSIGKGDSVFISGWYPAEENQLAQYLYREAQYRKAALPKGVKAQSVEALLPVLESKDPAMRYLAIRTLGAMADTTQGAALMSIAEKDHDWVLRKEAIVALGRLQHVDALPLLNTLAKPDDSQGLQIFARNALQQIHERNVPITQP